jgi:nitrogen fixation/metabolism regulation signal transduction histidine kinase
MFKNFKIRVLFFLAAILTLSMTAGYTYFVIDTKAYLVFLIPLVAILVWQLFNLIDKTNQEVASFLANIKYNDYAVRFSESKAIGESYQDLHKSFNLVNEKFRDIRSEKEMQFQYLQAIVEHVDTGLICFNEENKTVLINRGLQQLLHKSYFPNFESIEKFNPELYEAMKSIAPGERKLVKLIVRNQIVQLAVRKTILQLKDDSLHLYALQNIHAELEEQEVASWQKLIRILTHEIMNSIAPVVSLSETANTLMEQNPSPITEHDEDIKKAMEAIQRRSAGLLNFTQNYRQLTKIPPPKFQSCDPVAITERVLTLLQSDLQKKGIKIDRHFKEMRFEAQLDPDLIEQVLINLIKNAMDALHDMVDPVIAIHLFRSPDGELEIQIVDNGPGIPQHLFDEIFVPFFTTKKEGSGIGLSLCRQIIQMHKGSLSVHSQERKGTVFTIRI